MVDDVEDSGKYLESLNRALRQLLELHRTIMAIYAIDEMSWEDRYTTIFQLSSAVRQNFAVWNWEFEYFDPDRDYQDDVTAFVEYFDKRMRELAPVFAQLVPPTV